jgi:multiple sugar transport system permease protein
LVAVEAGSDRPAGRSTGLAGAYALLDRHFATIALAPALVILLFVLAYPVGSSIWYSLTDLSFMRNTSSFVGLRNYVEILSGPEFWAALQNGLIWTIGCVGLQLLGGFTTALLLNEATAGRTLLRLAILVPWAFPTIVSAMVWKWMLNDVSGIVNYVLVASGVVAQPILWLSRPEWAMPSVIMINVWFGVPFVAIALLAGLQAIPAEYYEVANIEGASMVQTLRYITIPFLKPIMAIILTLRTIFVFNSFELIFLLTQGGPVGSTRTLPILAYELGWQRYLPGKASAMTVLMLIVVAALAVCYFRLLGIRRREAYYD